MWVSGGKHSWQRERHVQRPCDRTVSGVSEKWQENAIGHYNPWKTLEWCLTHSKPGINAIIFMEFLLSLLLLLIFFLSLLSPSQEPQQDDEKG